MFESTADEALFRFLTEHGGIEPGIRDAVERTVRRDDVTAAEALCDGGWMDECALAELFQRHLRLPRIGLDEAPPVAATLLRALHGGDLVVPAAIDDDRLLIAMVNPCDRAVIDRLRVTSGRRIVAAVALLSEVRAALARQTSVALVDAASPPRPHAATMRIEEAPPSIATLAALLVERGVALRASGIHLQPTSDGLTVRYRVDGVSELATRLSRGVRPPLIAHLEVSAHLDAAERSVARDRRETAQLARGERRAGGPPPPVEPRPSPPLAAPELTDEGRADADRATATVCTLSGPKIRAVGSLLGAGVRSLCIAHGLDAAAAGDLELAVVEACGLATGDGEGSELRLVVEIRPEVCRVCLSDEGPAWAWPRRSELGHCGDDAVVTGARLSVIRTRVDDARYERSGRTNRLWLSKRQARPRHHEWSGGESALTAH